ncbi:hypothetical protein D3C72_1026350 [compost metagenome]
MSTSPLRALARRVGCPCHDGRLDPEKQAHAAEPATGLGAPAFGRGCAGDPAGGRTGLRQDAGPARAGGRGGRSGHAEPVVQRRRARRRRGDLLPPCDCGHASADPAVRRDGAGAVGRRSPGPPAPLAGLFRSARGVQPAGPGHRHRRLPAPDRQTSGRRRGAGLLLRQAACRGAAPRRLAQAPADAPLPALGAWRREDARGRRAALLAGGRKGLSGRSRPRRARERGVDPHGRAAGRLAAGPRAAGGRRQRRLAASGLRLRGALRGPAPRTTDLYAPVRPARRDHARGLPRGLRRARRGPLARGHGRGASAAAPRRGRRLPLPDLLARDPDERARPGRGAAGAHGLAWPRGRLLPPLRPGRARLAAPGGRRRLGRRARGVPGGLSGHALRRAPRATAPLARGLPRRGGDR